MTYMLGNELQVRRTPLVLLLALAALAGAAALTACNTTEGAGKDIKSVGKGIEESAHDNK